MVYGCRYPRNAFLDPPVHHVLHDMESVFWVGLLDGLKRSRLTKGEYWLENLYSINKLEIIASYKGNALRTHNLEKFEDNFSEAYSVMWQLLREWILRLFDGAPDAKCLYNYGD